MSRSPSRSDNASEASADSLDTPPQPTNEPLHRVESHTQPHEEPFRDTTNQEQAQGDSQRERSPAADANASGRTPADAGAPDTVSLFIGLGPAARGITEDHIVALLREKATNPDLVGDVRLRGRCAFADIKSSEEATRLIAALDGEMYQDKCRLAVQMSRNPRRDGSNEGRERRVPRPNPAAVPSLFVGLGPAGDSITDNEIRTKLEEVCPLTAFRRRGQCIFVDVASLGDAERMISALHNQYLGRARLSVQYSRDSGRRGGRMGQPMSPPGIGYGGGYNVPRHVRPGEMGLAYYGRPGERTWERSRSRGRGEHRHSRRGHRSRSRDRRRRRHSRSPRSISPRSASYSRSRSRSHPRRVRSPPSSRASSNSPERRRRHYPTRRM